MGKRHRYWKIVTAARDEACLATDLYNGAHEPRSFEAFVVHMHLAWLYLLQAELDRDGIDNRVRDSKNHLQYVDSEAKRWDLATTVKNRWAHQDPVRTNLEFFIALRNRIEHRYSRHLAALSLATAGHAQALLLNFEEELVQQFGSDASLAGTLRFPVFIGSFTPAGESTLRRLQASLPTSLHKLIAHFESGLPEEIVTDRRFQVRYNLIQQVTSSKTETLALEFIRLDELSDTAREALEALAQSGKVLVRDRQRPVASLNLLRPTEAAQAVENNIPFEFKVHHLVRVNQKLNVRPRSGSSKPDCTKEEWCIYDRPHRDYLYKEAYVRYLSGVLRTDHGFRSLIGYAPVLKHT